MLDSRKVKRGVLVRETISLKCQQYVFQNSTKGTCPHPHLGSKYLASKKISVLFLEVSYQEKIAAYIWSFVRIFLIVFLSTLPCLAQSVPQSIIIEIKQNAKFEYPDDYKMQDFKIKQEIQAYSNIQSFSAPSLPKDIFIQIRTDAVTRYPTDYEMQEFVIKEQVKAYKALQCINSILSGDRARSHKSNSKNIRAKVLNRGKAKYSAESQRKPLVQKKMTEADIQASRPLRDMRSVEGVPLCILNDIKAWAKEKLPNRYEMQNNMIIDEIKAYLKLEAMNACDGVPLYEFENIKECAKEKWPNSYEMQISMITDESQAYRELYGMNSADGVPLDVFERIKRKARDKWPNNYQMQLYMVRNDIYTYRIRVRSK